MSTKVTDLEKFVLEEIWRPYWPSHPDAAPRTEPTRWASAQTEGYETGLKRLGRKRHTINETLEHLQAHQGTDWHHMIIGRIYRIGFRFPNYIQHPLVDYIKQQLGEHQ